MVFTPPSENIVDACQFDNIDPALAQSALDADIAEWVATQTDNINNSISGGSPTITNNFENQTIDFCTGGTINITWTVEDICQILTPTASYTLTKPEAIAYTAPVDDLVESCEFNNQNPMAAQNALDNDIAAWVNTQTALINNSITGGCSPEVTNDYTNQSLSFCTGGSITVTWTIDDICETTTSTATYTLTKPEPVTYTAPVNDTSNACDFDNSTPERAQTALNIDISNWVASQTDLINNSFSGGCSPNVTNDFSTQSIDFCSGGSIIVTWTINDICETTSHSATYTYTSPDPVKFNQANLPQNLTVECDAIPNPVSLSASTNCGNVRVTYNQERIDGNCANEYLLKRTWTAIDVCGTHISHVQEITVQDTKAPELITNHDSILTVSCTDIPEAPELEFTDNCSTNISVVFNEVNHFDDTLFADYKIERTWVVTDECGNENVYSQELNVMLDDIFTQITAGDRCFDDGTLDLNQFLSNGYTNGTWELIEGKTEATLIGSIFDPTTLTFAEDFLPGSGGIDYVFRYTGLENGCVNITEVTMNIHADCKVLPCESNDITVSTAITPNNDGENETFDIMGIDYCGFFAEVKIFNRWGAMVYESNDYTIGSEDVSGTHGDWDGKSSRAIGSANQVPNGTYYYIINVKDNFGVIGTYTGPVYIGTK